MTPYYQDDWLTVYHGDCRAVMAEMEPESVHCVVTSPPYWGLRDYGTAAWDGGDAECDHRIGRVMGNANKGAVRDVLDGDRSACRCGATRIDAQLGLEPTPEAYVANMVAVFRAVRRVLRKDGTVWLNLGDSYAGAPVGSFNGGGFKDGSAQTGRRDLSGVATSGTLNKLVGSGLKPKDLVGIPWRTAFALQADGWYLRSDIIWSKPNPMPESVTDRPTKSHEYLFLLSKKPTYYFDADAVRETFADEPHGNWRTTSTARTASADRTGRTDGYTMPPGDARNPAGRNIRSVWTIATAPYPGAHFATFPPKLVEPCIKAGTSEKGVCPECGAPWERVVERPHEPDGLRNRGNGAKLDYHTRQTGSGQKLQDWMDANPTMTTGWRPTCTHVRCPVCHNTEDARTNGDVPGLREPLPASRPCGQCGADLQPLDPALGVVLDCFAGSGTTGMVAQSLSRRAVLIDLSLDYLGQLMDRNAEIPLGLSS